MVLGFGKSKITILWSDQPIPEQQLETPHGQTTLRVEASQKLRAQVEIKIAEVQRPEDDIPEYMITKLKQECAHKARKKMSKLIRKNASKGIRTAVANITKEDFVPHPYFNGYLPQATYLAMVKGTTIMECHVRYYFDVLS